MTSRKASRVPTNGFDSQQCWTASFEDSFDDSFSAALAFSLLFFMDGKTTSVAKCSNAVATVFMCARWIRSDEASSVTPSLKGDGHSPYRSSFPTRWLATMIGPSMGGFVIVN
eukprot:CAMPEP_0117079730 /NCGR_PEP_ID=MMETSP0472-20121206/56274_1 /TAXON_ID=693140 ORGANISM="Tiarina fusus, Strain LIS" /NCGR_SAMPLE_ID=MMETSP0472 /ASSEMBLY_ACC=CAM_ASM_000603 /LENGTH=112 /DNA_ID=CAMNT_0004807119 /DNA_START=147 /DNA_END=482 /DNA_ORIENTATION=-